MGIKKVIRFFDIAKKLFRWLLYSTVDEVDSIFFGFFIFYDEKLSKSFIGNFLDIFLIFYLLNKSSFLLPYLSLINNLIFLRKKAKYIYHFHNLSASFTFFYHYFYLFISVYTFFMPFFYLHFYYIIDKSLLLVFLYK